MGRKRTLSELQIAELKYRNFLEKRDSHNADARIIREERDLLNRKKGDLRRQIRDLRNKRSALLEEVSEHKESRNQLQRQAKELIQIKRQLRGSLKGGVEEELKRQRKGIQDMEARQQTTSLTLEQEERLLTDLRQAHEDLIHLEAVMEEHNDVLKRVGEVDATIDDFFQRAEDEHQAVLGKSGEAQSIRGEIDQLVESLSRLIAEADRVHSAFLSVKEKADHYHERAMELKEQLISVKRNRRQEYKEAAQALLEQKEQVRKALEDEEAMEEATEEALSVLRKKGKLEL